MKQEKDWISLEGCKIYDDGLWRQTEIGNPLSELVEIAKVESLGSGLSDTIDMFVCNETPQDILDTLKLGLGGDDTDNHVYLSVYKDDTEQKAMLWPY